MRLFNYLISGLLICFSTLNADWNPNKSFLDDDEAILALLNEQKFVNLKSKVTKELANTWCSEEKASMLMDLVLITKPQICVEIGAFTGSSILPVAATLKFLGQGKIYAIDAWSNEEAVKYLDAGDPNKAWWSTVDMNSVKQLFETLISKWSLTNYCHLIASPSQNAASEINNIDFLNIDGNYSEQSSLQDVVRFLPKVKPGGYILFSNAFLTVNGKQPKAKAFDILFETCETISEIDNNNTVIFRKLQ